MSIDQLLNDLKQKYSNKLSFLDDKPEETLESTIAALWFMAFGNPISAESAIEMPLPELTDAQIELLNKLLIERVYNKPLAHITGRQRFMGIDFICDSRALIPRKETEILGRKALDISLQFAQKDNQVVVIDVCCGAGNLGLAIAIHNPATIVHATDISQDAVDLTGENISFLNMGHRVIAEQGDLFSSVENDKYISKTNLIVCNPPYISTGKVKIMNSEILGKEPTLAFDGGMFGTKIIQKLIVEAPIFLKKDGWLVFEVGAGQGDFILKLCQRSDLYNKVEPIYDGNGQIRVISAMK
jgi:release factor glutamine methyltransferase